MNKLKIPMILAAMLILIGWGVPTTQASHLADGLVGYWPFDEVDTAPDPDTTPDLAHGNDGDVIGDGATFGGGDVAPIPGNADAIEFDGLGTPADPDYVEVADDVETSPTSDAWTISVWVNQASLAGSSGAFKMVAGKWGDAGREYEIVIEGTKASFYTQNEDGVTVGIQSDTSLSVDTWYHVVGVYDGDDKEMRIYLNGAPDATPVAQEKKLLSTTAPLHIGAKFLSGDWAQFFDGVIDELRLYDRALSEDEIEALYDYGNFTLSLEPESDINLIDESHTVTATLDPALSFIPVLFEVDGANPQTDETVMTDGDGEAAFTYTGDTAGIDEMDACIDLDDDGDCEPDDPDFEPADTATKYWVDQYAEISGGIPGAARPHGKGPPAVSFWGFVGDADGTAVGKIVINYRLLGETCEITPNGGTFGIAGNVATLTDWVNSCSGNDVDVTLTAGTTPQDSRGFIAVDDSADDDYDISSTELDRGNVHVVDLSP
jgi:hypothetical protein